MQQQTGPYTSSQYFKALTILCMALALGVTMFGAVSYFIFSLGNEKHAMPEQGPLLYVIVAIAAGIGLFAGNTIFKARVQAARDMNGLADKLNAYRAAIILFYALMEGPALFAVIAYFITGELKLLMIAGSEVLIMVLFIPNRQRVIRVLNLSSQQADIISDPNAVIG